MSTCTPTTPGRRAYQGLAAGHTSPSKRVHPRTSLHSPYSAHLTRATLRQSCKYKHSLPPLSSYDGPISSVHQAPPCSPQRFPLPRYQKRPISQTREDPAVSAIRSTHAEETKGLITILTRRLEQLSIEDHAVWEDLIMHDVCQQDTGNVAVSSSFTGECLPTTYTVAPPFPAAVHPWTLPPTPSYAHTIQLSSTESSPSVWTPQQASRTPSSFSPTYTHRAAQCPAPPPPPASDPVEASHALSEMGATFIHSMYTDSDEDLEIHLEEALERGILALLEGSPPPSSKELMGKVPRDRRTKSFSQRNRSPTKPKVKPVSATQVIAWRAAIVASLSGESDVASLSCPAGPSAPVRSRAPSPSPGPDVSRVAAPPVVRRRRGRATEEMIWAGVDVAQLATDSKRERRTTNKPYAKDQRTQRGRKHDGEATAVPHCLTKSVEGRKGRKQRAKRRPTALRTASPPPVPLALTSPKAPDSVHSLPASIGPDVQPASGNGHTRSDEARYHLSSTFDIDSRRDEPSTPRSVKVEEEDVLNLLYSALSSTPPRLLYTADAD
ncbi:hypothetical protein BC835DRAFT_750543 [Cytidiella melzeri]|nr:hypothetical protein BC835DRAFT_750543 [Cytidiella melzeri]